MQWRATPSRGNLAWISTCLCTVWKGSISVSGILSTVANIVTILAVLIPTSLWLGRKMNAYLAAQRQERERLAATVKELTDQTSQLMESTSLITQTLIETMHDLWEQTERLHMRMEEHDKGDQQTLKLIGNLFDLNDGLLDLNRDLQGQVQRLEQQVSTRDGLPPAP